MKLNHQARGALGLLLAVVWLGGAGCRTTSSGDPENHASAVLTEQSLMGAARAVATVLEAAGYMAVPQPKNSDYRLVYEKAGSSMDTVLYGGWAANGVWYRMKFRMVRTGNESVIVSATAYRVRDHGQGRFEMEQDLGNSGAKRCRELLSQVAVAAKSQQGQ